MEHLAPQFHFAWQVQQLSTSREARGSPATIEYYGSRLLCVQVQHLEHLSFIREICGSPATIEYYECRLLSRGRCSTWSTSVFILHGRCSARSIALSFCVAGAALGGPQSFCVAGAALGAPPDVRRPLNTMEVGCFCVAGAALGPPQSHFAWHRC